MEYKNIWNTGFLQGTLVLQSLDTVETRDWIEDYMTHGCEFES